MKMLNWMSCNQVDVPIGKAVYTQWLNDRGGIEADLSVTRRGEQDYLVVTGAAVANRDWHWLRRTARDFDVEITDRTEQIAMIGLMGPNSRAVLSQLTDQDLSNDGFPFGTSATMTVAGIEVFSIRMTYVGELGWELYVANDDAVALHDALVAAGKDHGLKHAGYHAMNTLRLESGYRHWGHDITDEDTPIEAGLGFTCAYDKVGGFRGMDALLTQKTEPVRNKRLIQFRLEDTERLLYHDEPIMRNGVVVGRTTSGMFSHVEGKALAMGYVKNQAGVTKEWLDTGRFEIEVATVPIDATPSIRSFYDPRNERVKV
jgi:4-methylaminobutanoate oxidase (formaldehyde-forming)